MKSTLFPSSILGLASLVGFATAYLVDPPSTAAKDTIEDCSNWQVVSASDTCQAIADNNGLSLAQFQTYNPSVGSSCKLVNGNSYCIEQNWGVPPQPTSSSALPTVTSKPTPTNGIATPTPIQTGMNTNCNKFYLVKSNDGCYDIAAANGISLENFYAWNPALNSCAALWPTYYVCVGLIGSTATPTPTKATPTNGVSTPTPTQSPFISNCNKFYLVKSGDGCEDIATANGISFDQFYAWNPAVGKCASLWPTYYVCVGIIGFTPTIKPSSTPAPTSTKTTPTNGISTPTPTQSGMVGNCDAFYKVIKDDGCAAIASNNGISLTQFYSWNPAIGSDCKSLWPDYYVCVSIVGVNPSFTTSVKPTTTKAGNGIATPTPIQDGMYGSCKKFYKVVSGQGCWDIANANGITLDNFYQWNPAVKTDCSGLWPNYYVCIGV
ncbi:hypothetical protein BCR34DRAFT_521866 [Clohesyomyces aquaticus]|uniref:LysM domain-containing protein n=1 Tax=Clohesyomyces aquaticus TaxID=1231657 RepID=A0A1Y1YVH3_9PLEO|nr:hypothetical protein BCR34DRAFT_521866 [Clohesyomyces aquaticus]